MPLRLIATPKFDNRCVTWRQWDGVDNSRQCRRQPTRGSVRACCACLYRWHAEGGFHTGHAFLPFLTSAAPRM